MAIMIDGKTLYEAIGGRQTLEKVHKIFYDKAYADAWLGQYFNTVKQETIENQQTDFMTSAMGGPDKYLGKFVPQAHKHMFITEELFDLREKYLLEALNEARVPENLIQYWLKIDRGFKNAVVKKSLSDCEKRFVTDDILYFQNPKKNAA